MEVVKRYAEEFNRVNKKRKRYQYQQDKSLGTGEYGFIIYILEGLVLELYVLLSIVRLERK